MEIQSLLNLDWIAVHQKCESKKKLLESIGEFVSQKTGIKPKSLFEVLIERERLGSTGLRKGIALPHGKHPEVEGILAGLFILEKPIDYDAVDDQPVDIVFFLIAGEEQSDDHLKAISCISTLARDSARMGAIREIDTPGKVMKALQSEGGAVNS